MFFGILCLLILSLSGISYSRKEDRSLDVTKVFRDTCVKTKDCSRYCNGYETSKYFTGVCFYGNCYCLARKHRLVKSNKFCNQHGCTWRYSLGKSFCDGRFKKEPCKYHCRRWFYSREYQCDPKDNWCTCVQFRGKSWKTEKLKKPLVRVVHSSCNEDRANCARQCGDGSQFPVCFKENCYCLKSTKTVKPIVHCVKKFCETVYQLGQDICNMTSKAGCIGLCSLLYQTNHYECHRDQMLCDCVVPIEKKTVINYNMIANLKAKKKKQKGLTPQKPKTVFWRPKGYIFNAYLKDNPKSKKNLPPNSLESENQKSEEKKAAPDSEDSENPKSEEEKAAPDSTDSENPKPEEEKAAPESADSENPKSEEEKDAPGLTDSDGHFNRVHYMSNPAIVTQNACKNSCVGILRDDFALSIFTEDRICYCLRNEGRVELDTNFCEEEGENCVQKLVIRHIDCRDENVCPQMCRMDYGLSKYKCEKRTCTCLFARPVKPLDDERVIPLPDENMDPLTCDMLCKSFLIEDFLKSYLWKENGKCFCLRKTGRVEMNTGPCMDDEGCSQKLPMGKQACVSEIVCNSLCMLDYGVKGSNCKTDSVCNCLNERVATKDKAGVVKIKRPEGGNPQIACRKACSKLLNKQLRTSYSNDDKCFCVKRNFVKKPLKRCIKGSCDVFHIFGPGVCSTESDLKMCSRICNQHIYVDELRCEPTTMCCYCVTNEKSKFNRAFVLNETCNNNEDCSFGCYDSVTSRIKRAICDRDSCACLKKDGFVLPDFSDCLKDDLKCKDKLKIGPICTGLRTLACTIFCMTEYDSTHLECVEKDFCKCIATPFNADNKKTDRVIEVIDGEVKTQDQCDDRCKISLKEDFKSSYILKNMSACYCLRKSERIEIDRSPCIENSLCVQVISIGSFACKCKVDEACRALCRKEYNTREYICDERKICHCKLLLESIPETTTTTTTTTTKAPTTTTTEATTTTTTTTEAHTTTELIIEQRIMLIEEREFESDKKCEQACKTSLKKHYKNYNRYLYRRSQLCNCLMKSKHNLEMNTSPCDVSEKDTCVQKLPMGYYLCRGGDETACHSFCLKEYNLKEVSCELDENFIEFCFCINNRMPDYARTG